MTFVPYGPEIGAFYQLIGPDGTTASFNNPLDSNFAGVISEITGLDSADVRDSGDVSAQSDGGWTGTNWYGRRPITLAGTMYGYADAAARNAQITKIRRATNAMSADATLTWLNTATGSVQMHTPVRRQQPMRITGGWIKQFSLSLVSTFAPLLGPNNTSAQAASVTIENQGDYTNLPPSLIQVFGPTAGTLTITNTTNGGVIVCVGGFTVASGQRVDIYPQQHLMWSSATGTYISGSLNFVNSTWFGLDTGNNVITTSSGTLKVAYNSAWV